MGGGGPCKVEVQVRTIGKSSVSSVLNVVLFVAWWLTALGGAALVVQTLATLVGGPQLARLDLLVPFEFEAGVYSITSSELGVESARIEEAVGTLRVHGGSMSFVTVWNVVAVVVVVGILVVISLLRRVFAMLARGDPFARVNAIRIRWIGILVIVLELAKGMAVVGYVHYLRSHFEFVGLTLRGDSLLDLEVLFLGGVLLVIAEVFRLGAELREEQQLTV